MDTLRNNVIEGLEALHIEVTAEQVEQLVKYHQLLLEWNEKINLTAIVEPQAVAIKHFVDSIAVVKALDMVTGAKVIDVGTGAGFPGIPLKIARPDIQLTLVDSLNKRCKFLQVVVDELGLQNVEIIHSRAEDLGQNPSYRGRANYVVSRAVAKLQVLLELTLPFVKSGGFLVTLKGPEFETEVSDAQKALGVLGAKYIDSYKFYLPVFGDNRTIGIFEKTSETPKVYPRKAGTPEKKPL